MKGTFKIAAPGVSTNSKIVEKHSWEEVDRAFELEKEYESQKKDKDKK